MPHDSSQEISLLINSMSSAEKRHFRTLAGRTAKTGAGNYQKLFDAIEKFGEYNEQKLQHYFRKSRLAANLPSTRYQLTKLILRSLFTYQQDKSVEMILGEAIATARNLLTRDITGLFTKQLQSAKTLAAQYDRHLQGLELLQLQREALMRQPGKLFEAELQSIAAQEQALRANFSCEQALEDIYVRLAILRKQGFHRQDGSITTVVNELLTGPWFKADYVAPTFIARCKILYIHGMCAFALNDFYKSYEYQRKLVDVWRQNPDRLRSDHSYFRAALLNYMNTCMIVGKLDDFQTSLQHMHAIPCNTPFEKARLFRDTIYLELGWRLQTARFDDAQLFAQNVANGIENFRQSLPHVRIMTLQFNVSLLLLFNSNFIEAAQWLDRLIDEWPRELRQDLHTAAEMLLPIVHLQLDNAELVKSLCRAGLRTAKKHTMIDTGTNQQLQNFRRTTLRGLSKIADLSGSGQEQASCAKLHAELDSIAGDGGTPPMHLGMKEVLLCLESLANNITLGTLYRRRLNQPESDLG